MILNIGCDRAKITSEVHFHPFLKTMVFLSDFCWHRCGSFVPSLRMLDPLHSPPSTPAEIFFRACVWEGGTKIEKFSGQFLKNFSCFLLNLKKLIPLSFGDRQMNRLSDIFFADTNIFVLANLLLVLAISVMVSVKSVSAKIL
jgi:hypothetical protein